MPRLLALSVIVSVFALAPVSGQAPRAPKRVQIADGIYLYITPPYGDVGLDGNAVAIVADEGVVMFDSNGTPAASAAVLLYLPKEKILITGDLLVNPISFALSCYPTGWLRTLERMDLLDATVIVPGHGVPLRDRTLLHATMDVFRMLLREGKAAKARGLSADEAKAAVLPQLQPLMAIITGGDARLRQPFEVQLVDWYLHRVYDELDGPLGDDIAAIPRS